MPSLEEVKIVYSPDIRGDVEEMRTLTSLSRTLPNGTRTWHGGLVLRRSSSMSGLTSHVGRADSGDLHICSAGNVLLCEPSQNSIRPSTSRRCEREKEAHGAPVDPFSGIKSESK